MGLRFLFWVLVLCASADTWAAGCGAVGVSTSLVSVRQDAVLRSRWGLMVDCTHPERPGRWVLMAGDAGGEFKAEAKVQSVVVREPIVLAGEVVRAWRRDGVASIETSGVAEESGAAGARIQVRLVRRGVDGESVERHVSGVVDGVGSVELR